MSGDRVAGVAAVVEAPGGPFVLRPFTLAAPGPGELVVRMVAAGICATDLHHRDTWAAARFPAVFGHEGFGVVEAVGSDVDAALLGRNVVTSFDSCGRCEACTEGRPAYCVQGGTLNFPREEPGDSLLDDAGRALRGGYFHQSCFATHALASPRNVVPVGEGLDPLVAAPLGCSVQTGVGVVRDVLGPARDDPLLVLGAGAVGQAAVTAGVALGCVVVVVEPIARRRRLAAQRGAVLVLGPSGSDDLVREIRSVSPRSLRHAVDTTARGDAVELALRALAPRGHLALVGLGHGAARLDLDTVLLKGLRVQGVLEGEAAPGSAVPALLAWQDRGLLDLAGLVTSYPFEDIEAAAQALRRGEVVKPVLLFPNVASAA